MKWLVWLELLLMLDLTYLWYLGIKELFVATLIVCIMANPLWVIVYGINN